MTPQELKNSILQLAIQGKLVEQRSEEGTAEELYAQIQAEKQQLIKDGKIKKEKPLPEITEDEKPFDIPESWKWIRFGETGILFSGFAFKSVEYSSNGVQVVRISDLGEDEILSKDAVFYPYSERLSQYEIRKDSFLICQTGSIGKMAWVHDNTPRYLNQRVGMFVGYSICHIPFLWYFLHTYYVLEQWISAKTSTNGNIKNSDITDLIFPLPPLAEQERIVAKIEELLPLIDRYEEAWTKLEAFNKRFPDDMQKSLLQLAIQGKLVEQRSEEGTGEELYTQIQAEKQALIKSGKIKKEKPLPEITDDEKPFDIPDSWKWVRLSEVGTTQTGNTPKKAIPEYFGAFIPFLGPGDIQNGVVNYDNQGLSESGMQVGRVAEKNSILQVCIGGSIGKCALVDRRVTFNQQINAITPICADEKFVYYILNSAYFTEYMKENSGGTATPIINRGLWDAIVIPLPPLAEQKRIVAKIEELLPLCERLK